jgi:hypothetical protein
MDINWCSYRIRRYSLLTSLVLFIGSDIVGVRPASILLALRCALLCPKEQNRFVGEVCGSWGGEQETVAESHISPKEGEIWGPQHTLTGQSGKAAFVSLL